MMKKTIYLFLVEMLISSLIYGQTIHTNNLDTLLKIAKQTHSEAVIIYKDNQLIAEKYFGIGQPNTLIEAMSCTKSIVGLAVTCMLNDGLIDSLDTPVWKFYPEWNQGQKKTVTIRHLVNMTSGLQNTSSAALEIYPSPDFVQLAIAAELSEKPGELWVYNNKSVNLLAGVIKKITGKRMDVYIGERLFKPLGITNFSWSLDSTGNPHAMSGCQIRPRDFAKIGLLLLNRGKFNNEVLIAEKYIAELIRPAPQYLGYGMLWWIDYEKTISIIDEEIIAELTQARLPKEFMEKVIKMKGSYNSSDEYNAKLKIIFGDNAVDYINKTLGLHLRLRKKQLTGNITYRADGYLGNYMIVDPKHKVVAVRMISHQSFVDETDSFRQFRNLVLNLTE